MSRWWVLHLTYLIDPLHRVQGGGIAAAFNAYFPDLVDDKVALVASAGLVEVSVSEPSVRMDLSDFVLSLLRQKTCLAPRGSCPPPLSRPLPQVCRSE